MHESVLNEDQLKTWIGKSRTSSDILRVEQARLMQATLDREATLEAGDPLPPLWHWIYFLEGARQSGLGRDGHAAKGEFLPPVPLPRRMWAGGRLTFNQPAQLGQTLKRTTEIRDITVKRGSSGTLCFVTLHHEYTNQPGETLFYEEHDIVYREDPKPGAQPTKAPHPPDGAIIAETVTPSPVFLFRYSALTFNSHRIHYDRTYCEDVEGYPGLIFHGPLTATLLADMAVRRSEGRPLRRFEFRATAPLFDDQPFNIKSNGNGTFWAETPDAGLAMKAEVEFG